MDPNATLKTIAEALEAGEYPDYETAKEFAGYLQEWLYKGGFAPDWKAYPRAELYYLRFERNSRKD